MVERNGKARKRESEEKRNRRSEAHFGPLVTRSSDPHIAYILALGHWPEGQVLAVVELPEDLEQVALKSTTSVFSFQ